MAHDVRFAGQIILPAVKSTSCGNIDGAYGRVFVSIER